MLVTVTNITSGLTAETIYISMLVQSLAPGVTSVAVSRTQSQIDAEVQLKQLVADGKASLSFSMESFDSSAAGFEPAPVSFSNATRPNASTWPVTTAIWNTDDNALNWSNGTDWLNSNGVITT